MLALHKAWMRECSAIIKEDQSILRQSDHGTLYILRHIWIVQEQ